MMLNIELRNNYGLYQCKEPFKISFLFLEILLSDERLKLFQISKYSRLSLSRNRRGLQKQLEISVLRYIRFVVLRKKQFEQPNFTNDYPVCNLTPLIRNIY